MKSHGLIEFPRTRVRASDVQENHSANAPQERFHQRPPDSLATELGGYGQVQNLGFALGDRSSRQEPGNAVFAYGYAKIVWEVVGRRPCRRSGAGRLDGGDFSQVAWLAGPDFKHLPIRLSHGAAARALAYDKS